MAGTNESERHGGRTLNRLRPTPSHTTLRDVTDEDHAEVEEGEVVVGFAVAAGCGAAFRFQPGVGALDRPAVAGVRVTCFGCAFLAAPDLASDLVGGGWLVGPAASAEPRFDRAVAEGLLERERVVATVGPHLAGDEAPPDQRVDERQQMAALVLVAGRQPHLKRNAVGVYGQVIAAPGLAQERARDLRAPLAECAERRQAGGARLVELGGLVAARGSSLSLVHGLWAGDMMVDGGSRGRAVSGRSVFCGQRRAGARARHGAFGSGPEA